MSSASKKEGIRRCRHTAIARTSHHKQQAVCVYCLKSLMPHQRTSCNMELTSHNSSVAVVVEDRRAEIQWSCTLNQVEFPLQQRKKVQVYHCTIWTSLPVLSAVTAEEFRTFLNTASQKGSRFLLLRSQLLYLAHSPTVWETVWISMITSWPLWSKSRFSEHLLTFQLLFNYSTSEERYRLILNASYRSWSFMEEAFTELAAGTRLSLKIIFWSTTSNEACGDTHAISQFFRVTFLCRSRS